MIRSTGAITSGLIPKTQEISVSPSSNLSLLDWVSATRYTVLNIQRSEETNIWKSGRNYNASSGWGSGRKLRKLQNECL